MNPLRKIWKQLPESAPKQFVRSLVTGDSRRSHAGPSPSLRALVAEIEKLEVLDAGVDDGDIPHIKIAPGLIFYGVPNPNVESYLLLSRSMRQRLPEPCYPVAVDIVCRYLYPHADVTTTLPYPVECRDTPFHRQHRDTIADLPDTEPKSALRQRFALKTGNVVIDAGAFMGYGALSISRHVGPTGRVISMEAVPANQDIFLQNMRANNVSNVSLVRAACWNVRGHMDLQCISRRAQDNGLVSGIVQSDHTIKVPTETIDHVVKNHQLNRVSLVSLTINGAEVEALEGMAETLARFGPSLTLAGWYQRKGIPVHHYATEFLKTHGYQTIVGPVRRVYGWRA